MTLHRWDAWEPREPPDDFAERTVAVALRERRARRRGNGVRWVGLGAAAAMLIGGAAWGLSARSVKRDRAPEPVASIPATPARSMDLLPVRPLDLADAGARCPVVTPAYRKPQVAAPESSASDAGRKVIVPRCDCALDQVMCTCF